MSAPAGARRRPGGATRIAVGSAAPLAALGLLGGVWDEGAGTLLCVGGAIALLGSAPFVLRDRGPARLVFALAALVLLGRALPAYFRGFHPWPWLAVIGLAALSFGTGILGWLLDRYPAGGRPRTL